MIETGRSSNFILSKTYQLAILPFFFIRCVNALHLICGHIGILECKKLCFYISASASPLRSDRLFSYLLPDLALLRVVGDDAVQDHQQEWQAFMEWKILRAVGFKCIRPWWRWECEPNTAHTADEGCQYWNRHAMACEDACTLYLVPIWKVAWLPGDLSGVHLHMSSTEYVDLELHHFSFHFHQLPLVCHWFLSLISIKRIPFFNKVILHAAVVSLMVDLRRSVVTSTCLSVCLDVLVFSSEWLIEYSALLCEESIFVSHLLIKHFLFSGV